MPRKPRIENKYNLTISKIKELQIADRSKVREPLFWRNDNIQAWCISKSIGSDEDRQFGSDNSYWIGIYDVDAKAYADKFRIDISTFGGMCNWQFEEFYDPKTIENEIDLLTQEVLLETINHLIDEGVLNV